MINELMSNPFWGITACILAYIISCNIRNKLQSPLLNPLIISSLMLIGILYIFKIPLESFMNGGKYISMLLVPATAILAVPIYNRLNVIKKNFLPVIVGCTVGAISSLVSVFLLSKFFGLPQDILSSLVPKSVTTAIAVEISAQLGGITPITVAAVFITGLLGNLLAPYFIKWFKIKNPVESGLAIGASSHALGTSKALEIGEIEGMMSGIALGICGLMTVFLSLFL